jgi:predicted RNase H-like HicB family nuclease
VSDYIGLVHKEKDSDFGVSFPDLPGVISFGSTMEEARVNAAEALALHLEGMQEECLALPPPSSLEEIMASKENREAAAIVFAVVPPQVKAMRVNVTIPADVLDAIDKRAEAEGFTRSGFLTQAARKALAA